MEFDGVIKTPPDFYAFVRVFDGELNYYGFGQQLYLEDFARKQGFTYKELFVCTGRRQSAIDSSSNPDAVFNTINCCEKSFSQITQITKNDFLVVSDISRLNGGSYMWRVKFNIIAVNLEETSYSKYKYREPAKSEEDIEYEEMVEEHREMMMEQDDQIFIESEEQYG